jgi:prepilin-type N-terminal cleavage/methylation domain-containing protein/prepilin-type processing-associated H-X9-DG protein
MNMRTKRYGFSLIELLVVIAIVTILAGILLPTLVVARQFALGIYCSNNVRQILLANESYSKEYHDTWPARGDNSFTDYDNRLGSWVPSGDANNPAFDVRKGKLWRYLQNLKIYRCPSDQHPSNGQLSYSINANLYAPSVSLPSTQSGIRYPKPDKFTQMPDRLIILVDEGEPNDGNFKPIAGAYFYADMPQWYHNDRSAFGFFDGHVALKQEHDPTVDDHLSPSWYPDPDNLHVVQP